MLKVTPDSVLTHGNLLMTSHTDLAILSPLKPCLEDSEPSAYMGLSKQEFVFQGMK